MVGDSFGGAVKSNKVWEVTGIKAVCEKYNVKLIEFGQQGVTTVKSDICNLNFCKNVLDADVIINISKMKTHSLMLFTGAIKNLFGTIVGLGKSELHKQFPSPQQFSLVLIKIYEILKNKVILNIMDGIIGMHGEGPSAGKPYHFGILLASRKATALDYVALKLMGFTLDQLLYIKNSFKIDDILENEVIVEGKWKDFVFPKVRIKPVLLTYNIINKLPNFVKVVIYVVFTYRPKFKKKCKLCLVCVNSCPTSALFMKNNRILIKKSKCIKCLCCHEMCPFNMISFKKLFF